MCIVCDIKADLSKSKATAEQAAAVLDKVTKLADALGEVLEVTQDVHNAKPGTFNEEQVKRLQGAADLLNDRGEMAGGLLGLLLAALSGNVKVEVAHVELKDGETPEQAVERYLAEKGEQPTKH